MVQRNKYTLSASILAADFSNLSESIKNLKEFGCNEIHYDVMDGKFVDEILLMDQLAKKMRAKRIKEGAITFDRVEVKFHLDQSNNPSGVYFKKAKDANKLIEEFMLLANRQVASFIGKKIDGDFFSIVGLPLIDLLNAIDRIGRE